MAESEVRPTQGPGVMTVSEAQGTRGGAGSKCCWVGDMGTGTATEAERGCGAGSLSRGRQEGRERGLGASTGGVRGGPEERGGDTGGAGGLTITEQLLLSLRLSGWPSALSPTLSSGCGARTWGRSQDRAQPLHSVLHQPPPGPSPPAPQPRPGVGAHGGLPQGPGDAKRERHPTKAPWPSPRWETVARGPCSWSAGHTHLAPRVPVVGMHPPDGVLPGQGQLLLAGKDTRGSGSEGHKAVGGAVPDM